MSNAKPGSTVQLVSNHFRLVNKNQGLIHIYFVDFGTLGQDSEFTRDAMRSCGKNLELIIGKFIHWKDHVFAMQLHDEEEFRLPAAANG